MRALHCILLLRIVHCINLVNSEYFGTQIQSAPSHASMVRMMKTDHMCKAYTTYIWESHAILTFEKLQLKDREGILIAFFTISTKVGGESVAHPPEK